MLSLDRIKKIWIWILLIFISLVVLSSNPGRSRSWNPSIKVLIEVLAPVQKLIKNSVTFTEDLWFKYFALVNTQEENERLKTEIDRLKMENSQYRELLTTHKRLQQLLNFKNTTEQHVLAAQVIISDPSGPFRSVIVDKGESFSVNINMPVVNAQGAVGHVVSLSPKYSKVLLLIDQNSAVSCIMQRSRDSGTLKGLSSKECILDYVIKTSDVREGDLVVTSGLDRIYPKGIPVGEVTEVEDIPGELFKSVKVKPSVDFSKLEEVLILLIEEDPSLDPLIEKD
ncbi:rod shape-determining protein MreC [Thermodesulfobacteriota bacterium]